MLIDLLYKLCMDGYRCQNVFLRWVISICYYIVTTITACYFGFVLSNVWEWFGKTGITLFNGVTKIIGSSQLNFIGALKFIGGGIAFLLIVYIGIILAFVTVKEYVETICYGGLGIILFFLVLILCEIFGSDEFTNGKWGQAIIITTLFISVFVFDFIRVNKETFLD